MIIKCQIIDKVQNMNLKEILSPILVSLESGFTLSQSLRANIGIINSLRKKRMPQKLIAKELDCKIETFRRTVTRINKEIKSETIHLPESTQTVTPTPSTMDETKEKEWEKPISDYERQWIDTLNLNRKLSLVSLRLTVLPIFEKAGWNLENYHILKQHYKIRTSRELLNIVKVMRESRYKENIFKDGQLV